MKRVAFVLNSRIKGKAKFLKDLNRASRYQSELGLTCHETSVFKDAAKIANELARLKVDYIIAVGGDGTLNEVVNGILKVQNYEGCIALLAYGTGNDFAKTLACPQSVQQLFEWIHQGNKQLIDTGLISYSFDATKEQRHFINIADLGIGAGVVQRVNGGSAILGANFTFIKAIVQTFWNYKNQPVKIITENWEWEGKINSLAIANGNYFGSGMCIAPNANPSDELFELVIIGDISIYDYFKNIVKIRKGEVINHPQLFYKQAKSVKIEALEEPCGIECDGEFLGFTPVEVTVDRKVSLLKKPL